jgi:ArsR family transcriptional regulator
MLLATEPERPTGDAPTRDAPIRDAATGDTPSGTGSGLAAVAAVEVLRAVGEESRLRVAALLRDAELTVSDLTEILAQSQPRVSRHLKALTDAAAVERRREGSWAFFRLVRDGPVGSLVASVLSSLDGDDPVLAADRDRLAVVRSRRADDARRYFEQIAPIWDEERSLHAPAAAVESAIVDTIGDGPLGRVLDLGTGTGRMLQLLAPRAERAVGLDSSPAMLRVARANLAELPLVEFRQGDVYGPPLERDQFDLVVIHQVLHYLDDPARAVSEAATLLGPGGRLLVVDFAPHGLDFLRAEHAHRRLGFDTDEVEGWYRDAGLHPVSSVDLAPPDGDAGLTVSIWLGADRRAPDRPTPAPPERDRR